MFLSNCQNSLTLAHFELWFTSNFFSDFSGRAKEY
jgi:hypothetical protein